ncbi:MAG: glutamine amidotransferase, partial [Polyangiaceae bacterium]|nr:glutamine amidotransferase [Polyangiaceae bacterium]
FPVNELFTEHLPSFDAVILQDIDARRYGLDVHFESLSRYVQDGGGLIMVGGPEAFASGGYANTAIEDVLPVSLHLGGKLVERTPFTPQYTAVGAVAAPLGPLRELLQQKLPRFSGANLVGKAKENAIVLWEHPSQKPLGNFGPASLSSQEKSLEADLKMPVLTLGEFGDGRSIALTVDGSHRLGFGKLGAQVAGKGHGALWEGLLGWLMRDPRFEPLRIRTQGPCESSQPFQLEVSSLPGAKDIQFSVESLADATRVSPQQVENQSHRHIFTVPPLAAGAWLARAQVGDGPATRLFFACEKGGAAFGETRPDLPRLRELAQARGGEFLEAGPIGFPRPKAQSVVLAKTVDELLPAWIWSLLAGLFLSLSWWFRRSAGYL